MKPLKPSMKENKRYLLVRGNNLKQNLDKAILDFVGVLGMSQCGLSWIKSDANNLYTNTLPSRSGGKGIPKGAQARGHNLKVVNEKGTRGNKEDSAVICVNRESIDSVRASLVVWPEKMEVIKVSGTLKGLGRK